MTTTCAQINATVTHFAHTVGDLLPCTHAAVRSASGSLECGARIRCAHCKGRHATVAEVARCAQDEAEAKWESDNDPDAAYERFLEAGGVHAERIQWEADEDRRREAAWGFPG